MTNAEINKYSKRVSDYLSKNTDGWIELGLGRMRGTEIRRIVRILPLNVVKLLSVDFAPLDPFVQDVHGMHKRGMQRLQYDDVVETADKLTAAALSNEITLRMGPGWVGSELPKGTC